MTCHPTVDVVLPVLDEAEAIPAVLLALGVEDRRFGWPLEMVLRADAGRWRIGEVPVTYRPRTGRSKVTGTLRGSARAVRDVSRVLRTVLNQPPPP